MIDATPRLTIAALARNEARHLGPCFDSLKPLTGLAGVDTLVLLDSRADEATEHVARSVADHVARNTFVNFSKQRNHALDLATGAWVFFIDPDERPTPALAKEIEAALQRDQYAAYRVPRRNIFFGREVRHTGWWPDYQVRLLKRDRCRYDESREVHEFPIVGGETGTFSQPLVHYNYDTWGQFFRKQWLYTRHDARALHAAGRRARPRSLIGQPLRELKRRFIDYKGYKDGLLGLALSIAMALYTAETYRQLLRLRRRL
jgi:glycosyltransferase involved in cell wall biosynthesis